MSVRILKQDGQYTNGREARWLYVFELIKNLLTEDQNRTLKVLDIGCADGSAYKYLKSFLNDEGLVSRVKYYGIDLNDELPPLLQDLGIDFKLGDFTKVDTLYPKGFFDVIIASEVIEHLVETDAFILSLKTILNDQGYIYLTTPNLASWHGRLLLLFGIQPLSTEVSTVRAEFGKADVMKNVYHGKAIMHIRAFTFRALRDFLVYHGFEIVQAGGGGYRRIDKVLFNGFLKDLSPVCKVLIKKKL